jgi:hypothetical protein
LEAYLDVETDLNFKNRGILSSFSYGCVNKSGRLDIQKLIFAFSGFLGQHNLTRNEKVDYEKLILQPDSVTYDNVTAKKIIFCEGSAASQNPFFEKSEV